MSPRIAGLNPRTGTKVNGGFTLLEVLIALGIVAVISLLSWRGLEEVLRMSGRLQGVDEQLQNTIAMFNQLEKDLQSVELGANDPQKPKDNIQLTEDGLFLLGTQRSANALSTTQSDMSRQQRLFWTWRGGQLQRSSQWVSTAEEAPIVTSEPLAVPGLAFRLWIEGTGWTQAQQMGALRGGFPNPPVLAGRPNPLNPALAAKAAGAGAGGGSTGGASTGASTGSSTGSSTGAPTSTFSGSTGDGSAGGSTSETVVGTGGTQTGGAGSGSGTTTTEDSPVGQIRMLQVLVTLSNGQTVNRIFEVGGLY